MIKAKGIVILLITIQACTSDAYKDISRDNYIKNMFMTEILNRMDNNIQADGYFDSPHGFSANLAHIPETYKANGNENLFYRGLYADHLNPSIRDKEFLQHSSLWGHQLASDRKVEEPNQMKPVKSDASLPAYCDPPNPCPNTYNEAQGCIIEFENTAVFSREFQASQECMCDSEHMFDCPDHNKNRNQNDMRTEFENFLMQKFQISNKVAKKNFVSLPSNNPFLQGEQLPTAAKKGKHVY